MKKDEYFKVRITSPNLSSLEISKGEILEVKKTNPNNPSCGWYTTKKFVRGGFVQIFSNEFSKI